MPINRKYPLEQLLAACRAYALAHRRKITYEYILIKDLNDSPAHAKKLAALLKPSRDKINLLRFNPFPGSPFERTEESVVLAFQKILLDRNYTTHIRHSKGTDISAACGQLHANTALTAKSA